MSESLEDEIADLPKLSRVELQAKWRSKLRKEPPTHLRKQLLVPLLAYKLQEQAYGGLKPAVKRRLRELAQSFERDPNGTAKAQTTAIKPGTRLITG
ncbi:MAG: DUF2924 domain-containing protein [Acidobacteriaceae bacterium]